MDPLTAFSLACGVIQVVDFGIKVVVKCRQIYKDGATSGNKEIESMAEHLTGLAADLKLPSTIQNPRSANQVYHDDQELLELAGQCSETATELINELQKLSIQGRQRKRDAFRMAVKVVWRKGAIENIQKSLECYRRTLDTRILISLRQNVNLILREQSDGIGNLDHKIQNLIVGVSDKRNTFDELKDLIIAENASSKEYISQELQKHREKSATEESFKRLLDSLYFPDMHAREEGIDEAHKHTFEWIFEKPGNKARPWHHFIGWLEEGHGTYWISGKAGSGKSTLMSFVCHDPRTEAALKIWSGTNEIFTPNFFFWSPGSQLQKSLAGLLRSLVYQMLERFPHLMPIVAEFTGPYQHGLRQLPTWTEQRLRAALQNLLSVGLEQCRLCVFIDGLDEFHGDHVTLLNLISSFREISKVKFCVSSRPYSPFKQELSSTSMLKLQDLTEPDIRRYVSDKLEGRLLKASWVSYSSSRFEDPVDMIVQKAEGVFLWVHLAVRDQLEGIRNGDDAEQLRERLQILPNEIEEVYGHMLHGIDKVYRKEVARYIRSVLDVDGGWSLFGIALAEHKNIDDILLFSEEISISDIRQHCKSVGERIAATCKGFIEVRERKVYEERQREEAKRFSELLKYRNIPLGQHKELREIKTLHESTQVDFLHRTAFDFFKGNEQGKEFLEIHTKANPHPQVLYVKALLADLRTFPISKDNRLIQNSIEWMMRNASFAEEATAVAQPALMDLIDRCLMMLWEHSPGEPSNFHWYRLWGGPPRSPYRDHYFILPKKSRDHDFPPVDFLGLAAWYGLDKYVQHMLGSLSGKLKYGTADYLLICFVGGLRDRWDRDLHLELIPALLKKGADPNKEFLESTVWGFFLQVLHRRCLWFHEERWELEKTYWVKTAKAFLESGANVHEKIYIKVLGPYDSIRTPVHIYTIELYVSTRFVMQQCFPKEPDFLEIKDPLIASGATLYSECTRLLLRASKVGDMRKWIDPKPSEQQLNQLTNSYEQDPFNRRTLDHQVSKIFENADIEQLYEQAPTDDEMDEYLQEGQSYTNIKSTNDPSSIDPPLSPTDEAEGSFYSAHSSQHGD